MSDVVRRNLRRLLAKLDLSIEQACQRCGLDKRTIAAILDAKTKPRSHTISRLAKGLGVSTDEFFLEPTRLLYRHFDSDTNPVVEEVVQSHPELFRNWTQADFEELHSRRATGGAMTTEGALDAARRMNRTRKLIHKVALIAETPKLDVVEQFVNTVFSQSIVEGELPDEADL